ncbi:uncharacterized protein [Henckelia pumila]|uniref:uncharacterized protein n=1 Tax=Henckelia pumila TaxID=405737 RepID=UPI003C6DE4E8
MAAFSEIAKSFWYTTVDNCTAKTIETCSTAKNLWQKLIKFENNEEAEQIKCPLIEDLKEPCCSDSSRSNDEESTMSTSSSDDKDEDSCLMAKSDQPSINNQSSDQLFSSEQVFDFNSDEFTREDLANALHDMSNEYQRLCLAFEEVKAKQNDLSDCSTEPNWETSVEKISLEAEIVKLKTKNDKLLVESQQLKLENLKLTERITTWNKSSVLLTEMQESQKYFGDKTGLGFDDKDCRSTEKKPDNHVSSPISQPKTLYNRGLGYVEPESSNSSWIKKRLVRSAYGQARQDSMKDIHGICYDSEKLGGNAKPYVQMQAFRDTLDYCSLHDIHGQGEFYTWVNPRPFEELIFKRLDRYVGTFAWRSLYPAARAQSLEFYHSDHRPIFLELGTILQIPIIRRRLFRFETHWITEPDCFEIIEKGWQKENAVLTLQSRISACQETLLIWAGDRFRSIPNQIKEKRGTLNKLKTLSNWTASTQQILKLEREIERLSMKEELYWKQRSRLNWLAFGDKNTKYFHGQASVRRSKNFISGLVSSHGDWCTDRNSMSEIVMDYFANLFKSQNPTTSDMDSVLSCIEPKVDATSNAILCAPFSAIEVRKALFDMHPDKAPGPDGMSAFFFQKFWDIIGFDVSQMVLGVLNEGKPLTEWNDTIITLIPKIKNPMTLKDFCPISLCNVVYKIIARALTNRLRPLLKKSVNEFQSDFIPERLISDNIILGFETLHWIRSKKKGKRKYAALKLDMSKAYDRVEWDFLESVMLRLGFTYDWVRKVMGCVRSVRYMFSLNGYICGRLVPERGIRQVDPLSPYLFVLCAHGLSSLFITYEARNIFSGGHEVYLGLPTFTIRSKRLQFRYLVEKVVKRIKGWCNKLFSLGGKEILIKSVLQAIPTYVMSCFRIPVSICEDIERECANFWWGMEDGRRKMHWKSWKKLCKPKCLGGLGFRHLQSFNKALLAKQLWRIVTRPDSSVAKVLKARYFKHQDVMEAKCGSNPSFIWRSFIWSRSLLEK